MCRRLKTNSVWCTSTGGPLPIEFEDEEVR